MQRETIALRDKGGAEIDISPEPTNLKKRSRTLLPWVASEGKKYTQTKGCSGKTFALSDVRGRTRATL